MSLLLRNLLDIEKYLLSELVYFSPPGDMRFAISPETPMPLGDFIDCIDRCIPSGHFVLEDGERRAAYVRGRRRVLRERFEKSENLRDVVLTGYLNDNYGPYGNTPGRLKSSLVVMALRDGEGNGLISVSGCEMCRWSSVFLDWIGCGFSFLGVITPQHRKVLRFYDEQMRGLPGERGVIGHSRGGNLATYVFISRLKENVNAYCINAQPYCWFAMTREQKAALKSDRFEYIVHTKDFAKKFGYVSYISRTVPLSRYAKEGGLTSHGFCEVRFDELGNLEGERVIRETTSRLKSIVFRDDIAEKRHSHEESLSVFQAQMKAITHGPRLLSVGLEEIMLTMGAEAATLWIRDTDDAGDYIYPYIVKGPASEALYRLKLRRGSGIAARSAFEGESLLTAEASQNPDFMPGVDRSTGFHTQTMITVPLRAGEAALGALQILNKSDGAFDERDLALAAAMAACMAEVFAARGGSAVGVREFRLLRVYDREGSELFSIEQNECRLLPATSPAHARAQTELILGMRLAPGDWLVFNRKVFDAGMAEALARMRTRDVSVLQLAGEDAACGEAARAALDAAMEKRPMLVIADLSAAAKPSEGGELLCAELRRLCEARTTTAVILQ